MYTFPSSVQPSYSYDKGEEFNTLINQYASGKESRAKLMRFPKHNFACVYRNRTLAERNTLHDFYRQVFGSGDSFWYVDFRSRKWVDEYVGRGTIYAMTGAIADDGGVQTDQTDEANNDTANDMTLLPAVPVENDAYYFGYVGSTWSALRLDIGTQGVGTWTITWEYWNGAAWAALADVTDGTTGFTAAVGEHDVIWTIPVDWALKTVDSISAYWVRARVSAYTAVTTQPKGTQAWRGMRYYDLHGVTTSGVIIKVNGVVKSPVEIIVEDSIGSTFNRGYFLDGNAFFWSSIDLSPYAGTDLGYTPYRIELIDGAGKKAIGYLGAVGAGETLESELITAAADREFSADTGWWSKFEAATVSINGDTPGKCHLAASPIVGGIYRSSLLSPYKLYKILSTISGYSAGGVKVQMGGSFSALHDSDGSYTDYITNSNSGDFYCLARPIAGTTTLDLDDFSVKDVTDPPATAIHIVSSRNGTTRNWATIESGFDVNAIVSWSIREAADYIFISGGGQAGADRIKFNAVQTIGSLITSDHTGFLRIKGRLEKDGWKESIDESNPTDPVFNCQFNIVEVQW